MRITPFSLLLAGALLLVPAGAAAQSMAPGWYVTGAAGVNQQPAYDVGGGTAYGEAESDTGWAVSGAVGYALRPWRAEVELSFRRNGLDTVTVGGRETGGRGDLNQTALMVNGYYDVPTGGPVVPYVGLGVGVVRVRADGWGVQDPARGLTAVSDTATLFGGQAIVGVSYVFSPDVRLNVDYRYMRTAQGSFDGPGGRDVSFHVANHALMVGLSYRFAP
ncbi:outer membrane protein [Azospirillum halopraeferens]|uniref:outer membrane protein n=1 Tax=Azospirillum halopraeferens TaxID=34010 RepID=UPI0004261B75|nr:outer membrane beta-barrel protein [Azospirillum halopraeferens]